MRGKRKMQRQGEAQEDGGTVEPTTVKLWPDAGVALGLKRGQTYEAAQKKQIPTLRFGKMLRVPRAWLTKVARGEI
jgi:hypothetical protein